MNNADMPTTGEGGEMSKKTKNKERNVRKLTVLLTPDQFSKLEAARADFERSTGFVIGMSPFAAKAMELGLPELSGPGGGHDAHCVEEVAA